MKSVQIKMGGDGKPVLPGGRANLKQVDMTTEQDIVRHAKLDDEAFRHQCEREIDAILAQSRADFDSGCFVKESMIAHIKKIKQRSQKVMVTSIKLDSEVEKRLEQLAASTGISKDYCISTFIQNGLVDIEDYCLSEAVMARVKSGDEKTFDSSQARKFLA